MSAGELELTEPRVSERWRVLSRGMDTDDWIALGSLAVGSGAGVVAAPSSTVPCCS